MLRMYATSVTHCRTFNRDKYENVYAYDDFDDEIKGPTAQTPNKFYHYNNCYYSVETSLEYRGILSQIE